MVETLVHDHLRYAGRRDHSGTGQGFHLGEFQPREGNRHVVREGGASLDILSGLVAGNFSAFWLGVAMLLLMSIGYGVSTLGLASLMMAPAVFAFGLVAFGFLAWAR